MQSMRDVNRVMEREVKKGSTPLEIKTMDFDKDTYKIIDSQEQLENVLAYLLRIKQHRKLSNPTIINNVYMQVAFGKTKFRRAYADLDRIAIYQSIKKYSRKLHPDFKGKCVVETAKCYFDLEVAEREKRKVTYDGVETYSLNVSNKYIMGLFAKCLELRRDIALDETEIENFSEEENDILQMKSVRDVLFNCLLLDDMQQEGEQMVAKMYTVYVLE